ncbi:MAG: Inner membrane protein [Parcubacteria group bacterium Greene0714_7]|nr:MAG: Inner membrane protein [Parcubacteria group bacterium Greene0714_7]
MVLLHNFWFIQFLGAIALVFVVLAWNAKTRRNILFLQSINLIFFIFHYALLSAYAGAAMCLVVLGRNSVFIQANQKKWAKHPVWFYLFSLMSVAVLVVFWKGLITILPVVGVIIGTYAISRDHPKDIRFYMLIACVIWIPYTIVVQSYSGLLSQIVGAVAILMGMYRHDRKKEPIPL